VKNGFDVVITILPLFGNVQTEIDLGVGAMH